MDMKYPERLRCCSHIVFGAVMLFVLFLAITGMDQAYASGGDETGIAAEFVRNYEVAGFKRWQILARANDIPYTVADHKNPADYDNVIRPPSAVEGENGQTIVSIYAWSPDNGTLTIWEVTIRGEEVVFVHAEIVDTMVGAVTTIRTLGQYIPRAGKLLVHEAETAPMQLQQVGPEIQVDDHWVEIFDDSGRTESTNISVFGFGSDEDVSIEISVDGQPVQDASGNPLTTHTDDTGYGSVRFTPAQGAPTGRALIRAISDTSFSELAITDNLSWEGRCVNMDLFEEDDERGGLTIERVLERGANLLSHPMTFHVHYTDQNIASFPDVDPVQVLDEVVRAYETQIGEWGFDRYTGVDYDDDGIAHLYINDGEWMFHFELNTDSWPDDYCVDPRGKDRRINLQADIREVLEDVLLVSFGGTDHIIAHEHFHNVQFAYGEGEIRWGHNGDWFAEGMARFIETVMDAVDSHTIDPLPSLFYYDSNQIMAVPDRELTDFDYDFAPFWGFLYQYDGGFVILERTLEEIRNAANNPLVDGPAAVSRALEAVDGEHDSIEEAYEDFAVALFTRGFFWEGLDWGDLLDPVHVIRDVNFEGTTLQVDDNPDTVLSLWGLEYIRITANSEDDLELRFNGSSDGDFVPQVVSSQGDQVGVTDLRPDNVVLIPDPNSLDEIAMVLTRTGGSDGDYWLLLEPRSIYVDVVLDIDRSGSMIGAPIEAAKTAAKTFIDLLERPSGFWFWRTDRDQVAIVSFASTATLDQSFTSNFNRAKDVIDDIEAGGLTNMGDALDQSVNLIMQEGREDNIYAIIYLTDGMINRGPSQQEILLDLVPLAVQNGISIYTFGFGDMVDRDFLQEVAEAANGKHFYAPDPDDLREVYIEISHAIKGWRQIAAISGVITQGETITAGILAVPPGTSTLKVVLIWPGSDLDLVLYDPSGVAIDPGTTGVVYSGDHALPEYFKVFNPMPGDWTIEVAGKQVDESTDYFVAAFRPGPLMQVQPTRWEVEYPLNRQTTFVVSEVGGLEALDDVVFEASDLTPINDAGTLSAMQTSASLESQGAYQASMEALESVDSATIPSSAFVFDPASFSVPAGTSREVLASITIPPGTPPGEYAGTINVTSSGGATTISVLVEFALSPEMPGVIETTREIAFLSLTSSLGTLGSAEWQWRNHVGAPYRYWIYDDPAGEWMYFFQATPNDMAVFDPGKPEDVWRNRLAVAVPRTSFQGWFWCGIALYDEYHRFLGYGCHPDWGPPPYGAGELHPWYRERVEESLPHVMNILSNTFGQ